MDEQKPVALLIEMFDAATKEEGCTVFDHTPEEFGLHVMEHWEAIRAALTRPQDGPCLVAWMYDAEPIGWSAKELRWRKDAHLAGNGWTETPLYTRPQPAPDAGGLVDPWLVHRLEAWPDRVDPDKTTNIEFLMKSAAAALTDIQAKLEEARDHGTWQNILIWLGTYRDHLPSEAITLLQQIADEAKTGSAP